MKSTNAATFAIIAVAFSFIAAPVLAQTATPDGIAFFEKKIRPVLVSECYKCHSTNSDRLKGGLKVDTLQGMLTGGDDGPVIVPGKPADSMLIKAIRGNDPDLQMPPKKTLPAAVITDLTQWVQMGAPWPKDAGGAIAAVTPATGIATDPVASNAKYDKLRKELWSWQPVHDVRLPASKLASWAQSDIDTFILQKLETACLRPNPPADKVTLLRRATFDLTGLPPTPAEIDTFLHDESPNAFASVIDRLLASPRFGERWGRHWLDVARYAESSGMTRNYIYYYAWRYRDYVIKAFNQDKPYDRFLTEQLAGDLLPYDTEQQHDEQLIATGFLAVGPEDYNEKNQQQFVMNRVDEQIDSMGKALLATTIGCARCHDHKFDPIPTADYYSLAGIFKSTRDLPGLDNHGKKLNKYDNEAYLKLSGFVDSDMQMEEVPNYQGIQNLPPAERRAKFISLRNRMANPGAHSQPKHLAMGVMDDPHPVDQAILVRGELDKAGPVVPRGFLNIPCMGKTPPLSDKESGRLELAHWIASPYNPLTSRVMVNRIWEHLFGQGLVRTVDNFGSTGEPPSHPELLDYLAGRFVQDGWSIKSTIRDIMLSSAYQQSSEFNQGAYDVDPDNHLLWRMNQRRLEAESIRDAMLASAGKLDVTPQAGSIALGLPPVELGKKLLSLGSDNLANTNHRSVYLPVFRDEVPEVLSVFDMADADVVDGARDVTTVAPQALFVLNNPFVLAQSKALADRIIASNATSNFARIELAYKYALGRSPTPAERERATNYLSAALHDSSSHDYRSATQTAAWSNFCQALFACAEFRYLN